MNLSVKRIPITNSSDAELLISLEPEGATIGLAPGETGEVVAIPEATLGPDPELSIEIRPGWVLVYLMCEKTVFVDGKERR
jgi:hypothetical protein